MLNDLADLDLEGAQVQAPASGREEKTGTAQFSRTAKGPHYPIYATLELLCLFSTSTRRAALPRPLQFPCPRNRVRLSWPGG